MLYRGSSARGPWLPFSSFGTCPSIPNAHSTPRTPLSASGSVIPVQPGGTLWRSSLDWSVIVGAVRPEFRDHEAGGEAPAGRKSTGEGRQLSQQVRLQTLQGVARRAGRPPALPVGSGERATQRRSGTCRDGGTPTTDQKVGGSTPAGGIHSCWRGCGHPAWLISRCLGSSTLPASTAIL